MNNLMKKFIFFFILSITLSNRAIPQVLITGVPVYRWQHGCIPTCVGMIIGFYDAQGFDQLIPGSPYYQNPTIDSIISSPKHFLDYCLPLDTKDNIKKDKSELGGAHTSDCIADFLRTSWSSEGVWYGDTKDKFVSSAFKNYVENIYPDYIAFSDIVYFTSDSWNTYKIEIDNNRPAMVSIDTDGDGVEDHTVVGIGYNQANMKFAAFNTWDYYLHWFVWRKVERNVKNGVGSFFVFYISSNKEPVSSVFLGNNYPNPFNQITVIPFKINNSGYTEITIYSTEGKEIERPLSRYLNSGSYRILWDGKSCASGVYFYQIKFLSSVETGKMILIR